MTNRLKAFALGLCASLFISTAMAGPKVTIVVGEKAPAIEKNAAEQLSADLRALFEADVSIATKAGDGETILLGNPATNAAIKAESFPKVTEQGHVVKSTPKGLLVGGGSPVATVWAVSELTYQWGVRHLLHGDVMPIEKPAFKLSDFDIVLEPRNRIRGISLFKGSALAAESWSAAELEKLFVQLQRLKFNQLLIPPRVFPIKPMAVDGDTAGRKAFGGSKVFPVQDKAPDVSEVAKKLGFDVIRIGIGTHSPGARTPSALPRFNLQSFERQMRTSFEHGLTIMLSIVMPGDLDPCLHFASRASCDAKITAKQSVADLYTPICGEGVSERLLLGFDLIAKAAKLIDANDVEFGVPNDSLLKPHLESKAALPVWITEAKTAYTSAMSEMYRANTRARGGARPEILYHAKRLEFAMHFCTAVESLYAAHDAAKRDESMEAAVEASYNSLNALADVARDSSDRGAIALMNEFGYRVLTKAADGK